MATPLSNVYEAFLAKVEEDEWILNDDESNHAALERDFLNILNAAIVQFRYPRVSLDISIEDSAFMDTLGNDEIQVLANLMKLEWVRRCIATWDNIRQLYSD